MSNMTYTVQGNLALKPHLASDTAFTVVEGGRRVDTLHAPRVESSWARLASRVLVVALAAAIFVAGYMTLSRGPAAIDQALETVSFETVRVREGDSLWSLAQEHPIDGLETAQAVEVLRNANNLDAAALSAGDDILVPVSRA